MTKWLLERALARLPEALRARYEAEWRADRAQLEGLAALRWALGLQRASAELRGLRFVLAQVGIDAVALGLAYYAAFMLRFDGDVPNAYADLFTRTLPFVVVGGLVCLAMITNVVKGVGLTTLSLIAYAALVHPNLVNTPGGLAVLNVPGGVCVIFALIAGVALVLSRYANDWARARSTAIR